MSFTFNNYATNELSKSPLSDIIGNLLGGYEHAVKASYLNPALSEQLRKQNLENKWYEPNIQSQIGLRGAQAGLSNAHTGLIGEQTRSAHMQNEYLPSQIRARMQAQQLKSQQEQMFNQMLRQRLASDPAQYQMQMEEGQYNPSEEGSSSYIEPSQFSKFNPQDFNQEFNTRERNAIDLNSEPKITNDDLINKKFFNLDTFTPKYKAYINSITKNMNAKQAAQIKLDSAEALSDFKESSSAQKDLPVLEKTLESAERMKEIIENRPGFFGHWIAPALFAKRSTDPLSGEFQGRLVPQIAAMEKQLSEKGNQLALKTSSQKLPGFDETQQSALGKMDSLIESLKSQIQHSKDLAGGDIVRHGNKRFKFIDGNWYELKRGDY